MPSTEPVGRSVVTAVGARKRNLRLGLTRCALYTLFYGAFVVTNAFYPDVMEVQPAGRPILHQKSANSSTQSRRNFSVDSLVTLPSAVIRSGVNWI